MKIHDFLPVFSECIKRWDNPPTFKEFQDQYFSRMEFAIGDIFDASDLYEVLLDLDWGVYRARSLQLNPLEQYRRMTRHLGDIQNLFELPMEGEIVLFGSFETIDGYARFNKGTHRVFLGVDESFQNGSYIDVLMTHELTHVVRESQPEVWLGFGLNPKMTNSEFTDNQPVIEHLFSEGFSCAVSEMLVPTLETWNYAYQLKENIPFILKHADAIDRRIHQELQKKDGDYSTLYQASRYHPPVPSFTHYFWAWKWVKRVIADFGGGDPRKVVSVSSKEFVEHALNFKLAEQDADE